MSTINKQAVQAFADLKAGYTLGHADVAMLNELARIALASLEADEDWVACSERMPEIRQSVIGWNGYGVRQCVYTRNEYAKTQKGREPRFEVYTGIWHGVTHWMPLPAAPQQEVK